MLFYYYILSQDVAVPYQIVERCHPDDPESERERGDAREDDRREREEAERVVIKLSYGYLADPVIERAIHCELYPDETGRAGHYDVRMRAAPIDDDAIIPHRECRAHFISATGEEEEANLLAMHLAIPYLWISTRATILHTRADTAPCFAAALRTDLPIDRFFLPMMSIYADGYALCPLRKVPCKNTIESVSRHMARMPYKLWTERDDAAATTSILRTMSDADRVTICVDAATASAYLVVYARLPDNFEGDTWRLCYDNPNGCTWNTLTGSAEMCNTLRFSEERRSRIAAYLATLLERGASDLRPEEDGKSTDGVTIADLASRYPRVYAATGNVLQFADRETPCYFRNCYNLSASPFVISKLQNDSATFLAHGDLGSSPIFKTREAALPAVPMTVRDEAEFCGALGITACSRLSARCSIFEGRARTARDDIYE
ncbi:hypothetical protein CYMTET_2916 [Cymbomonas tetramitiformis]|uniref:Uncharacterized protein n=1 Tax=Cymbomonas tetramitiformis TaxID=36881 RepID=A0AAE0F1V0_9CHLO|nr:hypothetical protein CYMTET_43229 [Cymbomonas tetramitiformis]KAK3289646.1 hypothetical protein CYMTET_2916 [Cymbomonas tetramitiformis]